MLITKFDNLAWPMCCIIDKGTAPIIEAERYFGTVTPLAGNYFVTAYHVLEGTSETAHQSGSRPVILAPLSRTESRPLRYDVRLSIPHLDLALLTVAGVEIIDAVMLLPPAAGTVRAGSSVASVGFPHVGGLALFHRVHRGHVVARRYKMPSDTLATVQDGVRIFELSYRVPKGLSGAAVLDDDGMLVGVLIGEHQTEVDIRFMESVQDGVERFESVARHFMAYGLAIDIRELLELECDGETVRSVLAGAGMQAASASASISPDIPL